MPCGPFTGVASDGRPPPCERLGEGFDLFAVHLQKPGSQVSWTQSVDEVDILVTVPQDVRGQDIEWEVHPRRLELKAGGDVLLEGDFGSEKVDLEGEY